MKTAVALLFCMVAPSYAAVMRAGVARVDITPQGPIWMSGYANRNHPSDSVLQPLWARALAIEAGSGAPVLIVSTDLVGLPAEVADEVAKRAKNRFGIDRARLLLNSSHTHTGPVVWPGLATMFTLPAGEQEKLQAYASQLVDELTSVIGSAIADLAPAQLSYGFGQAGFAMNRREPTAKGIRIGVNPAGPTDHQVPIIKVTGSNGALRVIVFGYACHNTTLTGDFYQLSGDYAGFAESKLEAAYPGATAMFIELCAGDQNPEPRGTLDLAEKHGEELAGEVRRVISGQMQEITGPIRTAYILTTLPFAPQNRSVYESDLANPKASAAVKRRAQLMLDHPVRDTSYPVQAIRFGKDLTVIALGGEVVVDYALRIKREYPAAHLIVAAYSNSVMCYIPTERVLREGGYEAVDNLVYYGKPGPFAPGVEERVMTAVHECLKKVGLRRG